MPTITKEELLGIKYLKGRIEALPLIQDNKDREEIYGILQKDIKKLPNEHIERQFRNTLENIYVRLKKD